VRRRKGKHGPLRDPNARKRLAPGQFEQTRKSARSARLAIGTPRASCRPPARPPLRTVPLRQRSNPGGNAGRASAATESARKATWLTPIERNPAAAADARPSPPPGPAARRLNHPIGSKSTPPRQMRLHTHGDVQPATLADHAHSRSYAPRPKFQHHTRSTGPVM